MTLRPTPILYVNKFPGLVHRYKLGQWHLLKLLLLLLLPCYVLRREVVKGAKNRLAPEAEARGTWHQSEILPIFLLFSAGRHQSC